MDIQKKIENNSRIITLIRVQFQNADAQQNKRFPGKLESRESTATYAVVKSTKNQQIPLTPYGSSERQFRLQRKLGIFS